MDKKQFTGDIHRSDGSTMEIGLEVILFVEDDIHYAFAPALDLYGYGQTEEEAKQSFETTLFEFIRYTTNKKTLYKVLQSHGWVVPRNKKGIHAPNMTALIETNEQLADIVNTKPFSKLRREMNLQLA